MVKGRVEAPAGAFFQPLVHRHYEKEAAPRHRVGQAIEGKASTRGKETVEIGAKRVKVRRFKVTGDLELDLWYDASGVIVKFTCVDDGEPVEFTLR